jgi:hypothetical protein
MTSLLLWCLLFGRGAKPHLYPICFYREAPQQRVFDEHYAPRLLAVFNSTIKDSGKARATITPDGRWIVASVTKGQNSKLAKVWPRVGCIGDAVNSNTIKSQKDCVEYIQQFVSDRKNYFKFGNARDAGGFDIWSESPLVPASLQCHQVKPN